MGTEHLDVRKTGRRKGQDYDDETVESWNLLPNGNWLPKIRYTFLKTQWPSSEWQAPPLTPAIFPRGQLHDKSRR